MGRKEDMVQWAEGIAADDSHGYSQAYRWEWQGDDFDCSSLMYSAAYHAGYDVPLAGYTGTMVNDFTAAGFILLEYGSVPTERGDVLLVHNSYRQHTEMSVGGGMTVGAHSSETGGIYGQMGDQTGEEISVGPDYGIWEWILRPPEDRKPEQVPGEPVNDMGFKYQAHVEDLGWCDPVRDGQVAGTVSFAKRMEAIEIIDVPEGLEIDLKAQVENIGWQDYGVARRGKSVVMGTTGQALRLEAFKCDVLSNTTGKDLEYRAHQQDYGWLGWTPAGFMIGCDGQARRLEAVQFRMV